MRVLITGSSGQIGANLALALHKQGHTVLGVDKRANLWTDQIETVRQNLGIPNLDLSAILPTPFDVVVHLAAYAKVHELVKYPERALENIIMAFNVVDFCRRHNLPLVFSSSREVYGNRLQPDGPTAENQADFAAAASPYSASKLSTEAMIYAYARCYQLPYLVFRFSNVYGRYDNDLERMERVIPLFIQKLSRHEPVIVYGQDKQLDFTYIDDCIGGVCAGIERLVAGKVANRTINLAYGQGNSLITMAHYVGEALGVTPDITVQPSLVGEVTNYTADLTLARALLDYHPVVPLREGIFRAVAWTRQWAQGRKAGG